MSPREGHPRNPTRGLNEGSDRGVRQELARGVGHRGRAQGSGTGVRQELARGVGQRGRAEGLDRS